MHKLWIRLCFLGTLVAVSAVSTYAGEKGELLAQPRFVNTTDRLIVKMRASDGGALPLPLSTERVRVLSGRAGVGLKIHRVMTNGAQVLRLPERMDAKQVEIMAARLATDPEVEYAEPDTIKVPLVAPNDTYYGSQWHYMAPSVEIGGANLPGAWDITTGSSSVVVGVIDTGILPHAELVGRTVPGYDFISDPFVANDGNGRDNDPSDPGDWELAGECYPGSPASDSSWHGSHVAGTIGAASNNGLGVAGINWVSKILPVRVLGKCGGYTSDVVEGMRWAAGLSVSGVANNPNPAKVLNLSLGGDGACSTTEQNAINAITAAGAVVVVAAGNSNLDASRSSPGNCNGVVTVAATNRFGGKASFSNYGANVEIAAPGTSVLSTLNTGTKGPVSDTYAYYSGTSMATPHVAGIVSLMLSVNLTLTPTQVLNILQTKARAFPTGSDCTTSTCGAGIVDAAAAVAQARLGASVSVTSQVRGDFNGDGKTDILWRAGNGQNFVWQMDGTLYSTTISLPAWSDLNWKIQGVGDFNADGKPDILWRKPASGSNVIWLMNGATRTGSVTLPAQAGSKWNVQGVGDFNADGKPDVLWRHSGNGSNKVWLMNGVRYLSTMTLPSVSVSWDMQGVADFSGDGRPDIVWRNSGTGANALWLMQGASVVSSLALPTVSDLKQKIQAVGDYNGDGKPDIVWRNTTTGANSLWLMNGTAYGSTVSLPGYTDLSAQMVGPK
jgi:serine protease